MKRNLTIDNFNYAVVNAHGDVLAVFRFSETARTCAKAMNDAQVETGNEPIFTVETL